MGPTTEPARPLPSKLPPVSHLVRQWSEPYAKAADNFLYRGGRWRAQSRFDGNPRRDSRVRQHVFVPFSDVRRRLPSQATLVSSRSVRLETTTPFEPLPGGAVRADATLHIPGSWPALPLWVTIEPWWRSRTIATVSLRSTRRLRYPRRYYGAVHTAMRDLVDDFIRPS